MAFQAFMSVKSVKQGQFKGEVVGDKRREQWIPLLSFSMGVKSPRDIASGQASGKRQWHDVAIVKEWGAASPQALQACATNEKLSEVIIEFSKTSAGGQTAVHQVVKLTDASIDEVERHTAGGGISGGTSSGASLADTHEVERWSLTFARIEVTDLQAKTAFQDSWQAAPA